MRISVRFIRRAHSQVHVSLGDDGSLGFLPLSEGIVDLAADLVVGDLLRSFARRRGSVGAIARIFLVAWRFILAGLFGLFGLLGDLGLLGLFRLILISRITRLQRPDRLLDLIQPRGRPLGQTDLLVGSDQPVDGTLCGFYGGAVLLFDVPLHRQLIQPGLRERPAEVPVPADFVVVTLQAFLGGEHTLRGRCTGVVEKDLHVAGTSELLHMEVQVRLRKVRRRFKLMRRVKSPQPRPKRAPLVCEVRILRGVPQHRAGLS